MMKILRMYYLSCTLENRICGQSVCNRSEVSKVGTVYVNIKK